MVYLLTTVFAFLLLVGVIITIHEGGHFLIGRLVGMKILEFSIGFGPKIYEGDFGKDGNKFKFTLRLLPLGGFVKPLDKSAVTKEEWDNLSPEDLSRSYPMISRWKKVLMVAGGPFSNFLLAFLIYVACSMFVGSEGVDTSIAEVIPQSIADEAGLKVGDYILSIDGKKTEILPEAFPKMVNKILNAEKMKVETTSGTYTLDYSSANLEKLNPNDIGAVMGFYFSGTKGESKINEVNENDIADKAGVKKGDVMLGVNNIKYDNINSILRVINKNPNKELVLNLSRDGKDINIAVTPKAIKENGYIIGRIGIKTNIPHPTNLKKLNYTFLTTVISSAEKTFDNSLTTLISIKNLVIGKLGMKALSGPMSIADISGKTFEKGWESYLLTMASISIAIGVFNLLPIPALDGGHLLQFTIEYIIRREIPEKILHNIQYGGLFILMSIFFVSFVNDITKYFL